jgi:hypothetical protein
MAVGDVVRGLFQIVGQNNTYDIKPSAGVEWVIHNLYYSSQCDFNIVDDSTGSAIPITFDSDTGQGARLGVSIHLTNGHYLRIKNNGTLTLNFSYDGVQTK